MTTQDVRPASHFPLCFSIHSARWFLLHASVTLLKKTTYVCKKENKRTVTLTTASSQRWRGCFSACTIARQMVTTSLTWIHFEVKILFQFLCSHLLTSCNLFPHFIVTTFSQRDQHHFTKQTSTIHPALIISALVFQGCSWALALACWNYHCADCSSESFVIINPFFFRLLLYHLITPKANYMRSFILLPKLCFSHWQKQPSLLCVQVHIRDVLFVAKQITFLSGSSMAYFNLEKIV